MKKDPGKLTIILVLSTVAIIILGALFAVNAFTSNKRQVSDELVEKYALKEAVPEATGFTDVRDKAGEDESILEVFEAKKGNDSLAFIYIVSTKGFVDVIESMVVIDVKEKNIRSVEILIQSETPGWGDKSKEPEFAELFQGLALSNITVVKGEADKANNEIDAISRATVTTNAVVKGVNLAIADYIENFSK